MKRYLFFTLAIVMSLCLIPELHGQNFTGPELLCRPTDHSITVNVVANTAMQAYFEYGTTSGVYTDQTATVSAAANDPIVAVMDGLSVDTHYYYRMRYSTDGGSTWISRDEHSFYTQRSAGSTFKFDVTTDSHVNIMLGNAATWTQTLTNVANDHPDYLIDLGDTFAMDNVTSESGARSAYIYQRSSNFFGTVSHSASIFIAPGNHEQEEGWHLDDNGNPVNSQPVWSTNSRKRYFPNPVPDGFYTGNTETYYALTGDQLHEDYYAWTWGDALFVVIDPFWYTTVKPFVGNTGGGEPEAGTGDRWEWTLGATQFNWLRETLENSDALYKFIFAHHMTGGSDDYVRKGAYGAPYCEWGGYNENGITWAFDTRRPGWYCTVHQLFVENNVSAFFHGHDHQYAYEILDGVVYQSCAAAGFTGNGFNLYSEANDYTIRVMPSSGHLRVTVTPTQATVDYVRSGGSGGSYSYTIEPHTPIAVQLSSCSATRTANGVVAVQWKTASEVNTAGFFVQRSDAQTDGFARIHDRLIAAKGDRGSDASYQFFDKSCPGNTCYYRLEEVTLDGRSTFYQPVALALSSSVEDETGMPLTFDLQQNYPNPFNPSTQIDYSIPQATHVTLFIYDVNGRLVKELVNEQQKEGCYSITWDGTNDNHQHVVSGTYLYRLDAGESTDVHKLVLLK